MTRRQDEHIPDPDARVERLGFRVDEHTKELIERAGGPPFRALHLNRPA